MRPDPTVDQPAQRYLDLLKREYQRIHVGAFQALGTYTGRQGEAIAAIRESATKIVKYGYPWLGLLSGRVVEIGSLWTIANLSELALATYSRPIACSQLQAELQAGYDFAYSILVYLCPANRN